MVICGNSEIRIGNAKLSIGKSKSNPDSQISTEKAPVTGSTVGRDWEGGFTLKRVQH